MAGRTVTVLFLVVSMAAAASNAPASYDQDVRWLRGEASRLVKANRTVIADTPVYLPGGYNGFWIRDYAYMLDGVPEAVPLREQRAGIELLMRSQRADGQFPDRVGLDGIPHYSTGDGLPPVGPAPPLDGAQFMVQLVVGYAQRSGDRRFLHRHLPALERGLLATPMRDNLAWIDPERPHSGYGFTDGVLKTGRELFSSVLWANAARMLGWHERARRTEHALSRFWDRRAGMLRASTGRNRQIDVWGSAFAVYVGAVRGHRADRIARYLASNYERLVYRGQVRHMGAGSFWRVDSRAPGVAQNGGYWATATGWIARAIDRRNPSLARRMVVDFVTDARANGVREWIGREAAGSGVVGYPANAAAPLAALEPSF